MSGLRELLEIEDLNLAVTSRRTALPVVSDVSLTLRRGQTLGLVGESGCGKTLTALSILQLLPRPPVQITSGRIWFHDEDLVAIAPRKMSLVRGKRISMIFQEPMTSLNPVFTIGDQVAEMFRTHMDCSKKESWDRAVSMLDRVGLPDAHRRARQHPHQMSGGMRQRVLIAIALACHPEVLIADEPTTALDVTVQAQILDLIEQLRDELSTAVLLITHDFGVVAEAADEVAVMYAGRIVEQAACSTLFASPWHPYSMGLLRSRPGSGRDSPNRQDRLDAIPGAVPAPGELPEGCAFEPRCPRRQEICVREMPRLENKGGGTRAMCWIEPRAGER